MAISLVAQACAGTRKFALPFDVAWQNGTFWGLPPRLSAAAERVAAFQNFYLKRASLIHLHQRRKPIILGTTTRQRFSWAMANRPPCDSGAHRHEIPVCLGGHRGL